MIFAEMEYPEDYWDFHGQLKDFLSAHFAHIDSGLQGDSWFWIYDGQQKVALDTFSSMKHQIKSAAPCEHVQLVIKTLQLRYKVNVYPEPEVEGTEDF
ncbi:hypothetical protein [Ottowia thiooxydans]|uniref:hypothetical protein n=1 Tax=Ottowia thiooxydans TaxID=219182 RepID=UPI00041B18D7|nr:hypothetical protein [Ottowia thiooxydans]